MNKSTLALAVAVGVMAQQAGAAGFIEDSKATLGLRNFYINTDNRDSAANSAANKANGVQSKNEEWGQGFIFNFTSGYTEGTVGFGLDAIALLGVRLDSGGGTNGSSPKTRTNYGSYGGTVFPSESNGDAVNQFSSLGLTAKAKISQTELKLGTLQPKLPVIVTNDGRLLPQTFQGGQITSNEIKDLTLVGGQIEHAKGRNSSNNEELSIAGANGRTASGRDSNKFIYAGGDYKITKDLTAQYYYGNLDQFYKQHFLGLVHNWAIGPGVLKSDFRYFNSRDDGANGHDANYYTTGYYGSGVTKGKVDNNLYSGLFLYSVAGHTFGGGYQVSNGNSDFPWLNQGDGSSNYTITDMQIQKFGRAGERTWQARYAYDFAKVGVPGLTAGAIYLRGDNIDHATGDKTEWERDLTVAYVIPEGPLKNLGLTWKNAMWRNDIPGQRDQDENRLIVSYSIPLL
ncbi:Outer membrane low permeability porin OccK8/OprE [Pseudomonas chlororaphis subsp. aurantiaca]|uniref:OprD family porin n=1 Tax=Pseudomonas chlororaphis TaxID=587753 RepID=UPI00050D86EA|nr:OprD family porin [Pseudomonas chlororaphis]AIS10418.1 porin [Pseudomonas chlororaphis subsp. aurantiaca]AZD38813.1 Outer membrane low permeability porin OccK8/OprE [Pseudomonas chlororaphis subsp. aurantiaca]AZD45154.1 Outer membrane low permeability porin OccK8/OprE [Pseudomonas chlororaphis subsp. aurantiaca]AZD76300.1 Outer membrane low permeability porin OccK8/OprE [Pseudomonas chlororaphis subsp. aurantiaca]AZD82545.1 Outer membrane low permeability porin OccK8/OprE [Pseudomonas chlor